MITLTPYQQRSAWKQAVRAGTAAVLRISLLASYTVDQLVPYLGLPLHQAGLPARFHVGPFDQIVRQCLDDDGETAAAAPDVLVTAPRFEELGPAGPRWARDLTDIADTALAAAGRWQATLVFVLPALPDERDLGVGDAASLAGTAVLATWAWEAARALLAGQPGVLLADAEDAIRDVGAARAHHPAMFQLAKVPYTEELFARLGGHLARLLASRYGAGVRAVVLDGDSLSDAPAAALRGPLRALHRSGTRIGLCATDPAVWTGLATHWPELVVHAGATAINPGPAATRLAEVATALDVPAGSAVLVTTDPDLLPGRAVLLGPQPETWPATLAAADCLTGPHP